MTGACIVQFFLMKCVWLRPASRNQMLYGPLRICCVLMRRSNAKLPILNLVDQFQTGLQGIMLRKLAFTSFAVTDVDC